MVYRDLATDIFTKMAYYVLNDPTMYQRFRSLLLAEKRTRKEEMGEDQHLYGTDAFLKFAQSMVPGQTKTKNTRATIKKVMKNG
jgi:hypothetical protein